MLYRAEFGKFLKIFDGVTFKKTPYDNFGLNLWLAWWSFEYITSLTLTVLRMYAWLGASEWG